MRNDTLMTKIKSNWKPEIEFQYGCRPFSETGSSLSQARIEISHRYLVCR